MATSAPKLPKKVKPGDPITAQQWNELIDLILRSGVRAGQGSGLHALQTPQGVALAVMDRGNKFLCVANGDIPARTSGDAGVGSVYLVSVEATYDSSGNLTAATLATWGDAIDVYNPSSMTMTSGNGIDDGMYCWIEEYPSGMFAVAPLECS